MKGFTLILLLQLVLLFGWCANIFQICDMSTIMYNGSTVLKIVGIFVPPLGAIMGFIDL